MKTLASVLSIILCVFALQAWAQSRDDRGTPLQIPIVFALEAKPLWVRADLDVKDQFQLRANRNLWEFDAAVLVGDFHFKYALTTGFGNSDRITPTGLVTIGGTEFGEKKAGAASSAPTNLKAIDIDWTQGASHRCELTKFLGGAIRPIVVGELFDVRVGATGGSPGGSTGGSPKQGSETFRPFVWGAGLQYIGDLGFGAISATLVGSAKYNLAEINYQHDLTEWLALSAGYQHKTVSSDGWRLRQGGWFAGLSAVW